MCHVTCTIYHMHVPHACAMCRVPFAICMCHMHVPYACAICMCHVPCAMCHVPCAMCFPPRLTLGVFWSLVFERVLVFVIVLSGVHVLVFVFWRCVRVFVFWGLMCTASVQQGAASYNLGLRMWYQLSLIMVHALHGHFRNDSISLIVILSVTYIL